MREKYYAIVIMAVLLCLSKLNVNAQKQSESFICGADSTYLDGQKVLLFSQKMPEYPGGTKEMLDFIVKNFRYPKDQEIIQESLTVYFVIDTTGQVRNECIFKRDTKVNISPVEIEALRVVRLFPKWEPAQLFGKRVPVRYLLPIYF